MFEKLSLSFSLYLLSVVYVGCTSTFFSGLPPRLCFTALIISVGLLWIAPSYFVCFLKAIGKTGHDAPADAPAVLRRAG